jgi:AAA family ATP:ADP antiporter
VSVLCAWRLGRWAQEVSAGRPAPVATAGAGEPAPPGPARPARGDAPLGGSAFAGFRVVFRSPYLAGIAIQVLLYSLASTFLYFQQARIVADALPDSARRTSLFAAVDLAVNLGAMATQGLLFGRIAVAHGLGAPLAIVPAISTAGFATLAAAPSLVALVLVQSIRRAAHFGLEKPGRDALYTVVSREEKYKAKSFVDTVVYRGGDAVWGWAYAGLAALGLALPAIALVALPAAAISISVALWLARRHGRLERT